MLTKSLNKNEINIERKQNVIWLFFFWKHMISTRYAHTRNTHTHKNTINLYLCIPIFQRRTHFHFPYSSFVHFAFLFSIVKRFILHFRFLVLKSDSYHYYIALNDAFVINWIVWILWIKDSVLFIYLQYFFGLTKVVQFFSICM